MLSVHKGDTVRLVCTFHDWEGEPADPDSVVVRLYNKFLTNVGTFPLGSANRMSMGMYFFDWSTDQVAEGRYYFEFSGQLEGKPILRRGMFEVTWD